VLARYDRVVVPEMNLGQLCRLVRAKYLVDAESFPKVKGAPFTVAEIESCIEERTAAGASAPTGEEVTP